MNRRRTPLFGPLIIVTALLLLQFALRAHHPARQDPYIDEGFHITRAARVWDFAENPGRFSQGKVLLYFWLGLFEAPPLASLPAARLSMALFSLISGAAIYQVGRRLYNPFTGIIALGLYAVLPLGLFYERMAMADPFASGFAALIVWRSLAFARRPVWYQGVILGVLLALATMAKLTMALLPALPIVAALLFYPWRRGAFAPQAARWLRRYVPPLIVAAVVVLLLWAPLAVPAYVARHTDRPFLLVNDFNLRSSDEQAPSVTGYIRKVLPLVEDFAGEGFLLAALCAIAVQGVIGWGGDRRWLRGLGIALAWLVLILVLPFGAARLPTARYMMPAAAPLALLLAGGIGALWSLPRGRWLFRAAVIAGLALWLGRFAVPFIRTDLTTPERLPIHGINYDEYILGSLSADDSVRQGAASLNALHIPPDEPIYANWNLCHLLYFYSAHPVECLQLNRVDTDFRAHLRDDVPPGGITYIALRGYGEFFDRLLDVCWEEVASHRSPLINRYVTIWRVQREPCSPGDRPPRSGFVPPFYVQAPPATQKK